MTRILWDPSDDSIHLPMHSDPTSLTKVIWLLGINNKKSNLVEKWKYVVLLLQRGK